jgi:hypothetical protein
MGMYDGLQELPSLTAPPPPAPPSMYDGLTEIAPGAPRAAAGAIESLQAGIQASAPGLAWRGKLPDLVLDPAKAKWWERALTGIGQVGADLPIMAVGAALGGPAGAATGAAVTGPAAPVGAAVGTILGAGAGMFALPGFIRESLTQAYSSGEISTAADWWNIVRAVAATTGKEAVIGAATFGAGSIAARTVGKALVPAIGESIAVPTAVKAIGAADTAAQIATMVTMPAAFQGRLPDAIEFMDAAIVIGGLKGAHVMANKLTNIYRRTGRTPAQVVEDAKADPKIAEDLAKQEEGAPEGDIPTFLEQLTKQEELWTIQDRLGLLDRQAPETMTPEARAEAATLRTKVAALEAEGIKPEAPVVSRETPPAEPRYAPEQLTEAKDRAAARIAELTTKEGQAPLTDMERAERIGLVNALDKPEILAKRFGIEPAIKAITDAERQASAERVAEEVRRQAKEADMVRDVPLGDEHVDAITQLVLARVKTRAARLGILPEELYAQRPILIRDEAQAEIAAEQAAIPPEAPRFAPPEVDLFGNPIAPETAPRAAIADLATQEVPLAGLRLSAEVPQFKKDANAEGVIVPLGGKFDRTGVGPIQVWERLDGTMEVISGRHRLDLARRSGEETIPAQIHREADGFTAKQAATLDAQLNIREEQGSVADYAQYFRDSGISNETANELGLLARAKGRGGFAIARDASPDTLAAHRAGLLSDDAALAISQTAPGSERLQALGIAMVNDGKSTLYAANMMRSIDLMASERMAAGAQGDIFGFDDSAMREAAAMAKKASSKQRAISEQISAVSGASRRPELARKMGVDVQDPEGIQKKIAELKQEQYQWDNWPLYPELVAKLRAQDLHQDRLPDQQTKSWDEWAENYGKVAGEDLTKATTNALYRASNFADATVRNLQQAAQRGEPYNADLLRSMQVERDAMMAEWRTRPDRFESAAPDFELKPETPAELKARDAEAAAAAKRKLAQERAGVKGPVPTVDQLDIFNTQRTLFQSKEDKPWYYSELARQVEALPAARVPAEGLTGAEWSKLIWEPETTKKVAIRDAKNKPTGETKEVVVQGKSNLPGVKQEEIEWTGINDWLAIQEGKVTKEQVQAFMEQGGVKVTETVLGFNGEAIVKQINETVVPQIRKIEGRIEFLQERVNNKRYSEKIRAEMAAELPVKEQELAALNVEKQRLLELRRVEDSRPDSKFEQYQLPGSVPGSYRELVLTLPATDGLQIADRGGMFGYKDANGEDVGGDFRTWAEAEQWRNSRRKGTFESSHFPGHDYLAHTRINDRILPDGRKVLFVEEIQSDRAQKGRTEGFQKVWTEPEVAKFTVEAAPDQAWNVYDGAGNLLASPPKHLNDTAAAALQVVQKAARAGTLKMGAIPTAPFVTKTDSWTALVLKRLLRYAAEGEYDAIAWTRGEQQVDRYTSALRKAVDTIEWKKTPAGVQIVGYKGKPGGIDALTSAQRRRFVELDEAAASRELTPSERRDSDHLQGIIGRNKVVDTTEKESALSDAIGKSMADRIIKDPNQTGTIEGENININDTGMAGYYDRIVPKVAADVAKKVGGGKVGEIEIGGKKLTPDERRTLRVLLEEPGTPTRIQQEEIDRLQAIENALPEKQQAIAITPAMREKIMAGQALFQTNTKEVFHARTKGEFTDGKASAEIGDDADLLGKGFYFGTREFVEKNYGTPEPFQITGPLATQKQWMDALRPYAQKDIRVGRASARAYLQKQGYVGVDAGNMGVVWDSAAISNRGPFDQNKPQDRGDQHLGSYSIAENLITTFRNANKSTIVHELSHSWLEEMKADAARPDAPAQIKADWEIIRREFAIGEQGDISTASHEQFARTAERYYGEGRAPSVGLRAVFERFKAWMLEIYANLQNMGVEVNPEIRGMFDRMLATDQEIADAKALDVPRAYVPEARAAEAEKIVPAEPPPKKQPEPGFKDEQLALDPFAKQLLEGPGSGPTEDSRVNAKYINAPEHVKLAIQRVAEIDQQGIQAARGGEGGVKSWEQANAEADAYITETMGGKMAPDAAGGIPHDIRQRAAFKVMVSVVKYSLSLRDVILQKGDNATVQDQFDYLNSIVRMRMTHAEFLGLRAAGARAMNQIRDMTPESGAVDKMVEATSGRELFQTARTDAEMAAELKLKLQEIMAQHFSGKSAVDIARLHKDVKDLSGGLKFAKAVTEATKWEMVVEGWKAGLLSGPVTHTTNLFGTGAFQVLRAPVDALASIIGIARGASPGMGESDRASMSEAVARITGMLGGVQDGLKVAAATFRLDDPTGKTEAYRTANPGRAGEIIRIPLRLMGAEDALVTTMYMRGELKTQAIRQAFDEQLNPSTREFAERVQHLTNNPTPDIQAAAEAAATRMTFNAPLGEKGVALQLFVNKWNLQWMIPFIRTPINIAKELLRMSPFAPAVGEWRADIAKGGVARDRALAEIALGTGITVLTMAYAFAGNISGAGDADPGKNRGKAGVWQPYSILIGDTWYEYARIQPTGTLMGMAADIANIWDHMTDEEKDKLPKLISAAFAQAITNQTFLQGITNFVNAMSDPARFGPRFLQQMAASTVPNIIGQPTTMADPVVREVNGMIEAIQARVPGMRQDLLPKRDWLGGPVETKERVGVVLPSRTLKVSEDKVRLEAARMDISMAAAPKKTHIGKGTGKLGDVPLTPEERNTFAKVGGEMAHKILTNIVNAPGYDQIPDLVKRKIFSKVQTASHQVAAVAALPMDKRIAYIQSISEKVATELAPEP